MGVSGSGKSTIARALATKIGAEFCDADGLHTPQNLAKMAKGQALNDEDRWPWLHALGQQMKQFESNAQSSVTACSALKKSYRDVLREHVPDAFFVFLDGSFEVIQARLETRSHEFMPPSLLVSQFETLEPLGDDEVGTRVSIVRGPDEVVNELVAELTAPSMARKRNDKGLH
jgi:carbohydrate kinase (thermoresistant glucokinase family)